MKWGTQRKLAQRAGITEASVSNIVNGKRRPSWLMAKKLAEATGTDPSLWMDAPPDVLKEALGAFKE